MKRISAKRSIKRSTKKVRAWYAKTPLVAIPLTIVLLVAVCGTSYGAYNYVASQKQTGEKVSIASPKEAKPIEGIDEIEKDLAEDTSDNLKKASETKKDYSDPRAPTLTTGAGCAGIACYELGGFSIKASPSVISMKAGDNNVPITISTVDGKKADWGGMPEAGGVGTHGNTFPGNSRSFTYYIDARETAKGAYYLEFSATREKPTRQWAKVKVKVNVTAGPYYTISVGTVTLTNASYPYGHKILSIPFKINHYNGHTEGVSTDAYLTCPNNSPVWINKYLSDDQVTHGVILQPFTTPNTCKIKFNAEDSSGRIFDNLIKFKVQ